MKIVKQLVKLHKILFSLAVLFTFLSVILNLCWNRFLAQLLDILENADSFYAGNGPVFSSRNPDCPYPRNQRVFIIVSILLYLRNFCA